MQNKKRFTLLELLIVVAIIAVLLTILLPSLNKAKKRAQVAVCASNQSQLAKGFFYYANNNNYRLPPGERNLFSETPKYNWKHSWDDQISEYIGNKLTNNEINQAYLDPDKELGVLKCPSDNTNGIIRRGLTNKQAALRSYNVNAYRIWFEQSRSGNLIRAKGALQKSDTGIIGMMLSRHLATIKNTSSYFLTEGFQGLAGDGGWSAIVSRRDLYSPTNFYKNHFNNNRNYLLIDGSVVFKNNKDIYKSHMLRID